MHDNTEWFTVEEIDPMTYAISEYGHWEQVHSYLLLGDTFAALIDTGLGIANIKQITDSLTDLPIKVLTTHVHWDHIGGHQYYDELYVHAEDANWLRKGIPLPLEVVRRDLLKEPVTRPLPEGFALEKYVPFTGEPTAELQDNDVIDLGGRTLRILHTPGHSPGHLCVYEVERGYLYTGDLLYKGTLYAFYPSTDPVAFAASIERLANLAKVAKILPAHNELHISVELLQKTDAAFKELASKGLLQQGTGVHDFGEVQIKL